MGNHCTAAAAEEEEGGGVMILEKNWAELLGHSFLIIFLSAVIGQSRGFWTAGRPVYISGRHKPF